VKALARKSALSYKAKDQSIVVVEDFSFEAPKTKDFVAMLKGLQIENRKTLLVLPEKNELVFLSARNLEKANVVTASELNTYRIMNTASLVLTESSVEMIEQNLNA
jgi:large subunit ribosomal protein L4